MNNSLVQKKEFNDINDLKKNSLTNAFHFYILLKYTRPSYNFLRHHLDSLNPPSHPHYKVPYS